MNVAGLHAKLKIKDGNTKDVDHYIETLENQDLANRLTLIRLSDAIWRRCYEPVNTKKAAFGSGEYRQKAANPAPAATRKHIRAVQIRSLESESESGSDSDGDNHQQIYLAAEQDATLKMEPGMEKIEQVPITHKSTDQAPPDHRSRSHSGGTVASTADLGNTRI
ncbi:Hypothetical protein PHPALM_20077 [Phytophthora palmivora]|uniref:Uncharacterized protein n=1 Tax=Phytophthora palmivora TaxID=4796 RepID=A0A2P4XFS5_9STRA|nr:Hypothetical protein PHPALM_20077 [Phytophthora palmivora]